MTEAPPFISRWKSQDVYVERDVLRHNEYRLPDSFEPDDVIVDVGAHVGSFAYACLSRGAGRVLSYEPEKSAFEMLKQNTAHWGERAELHNAAAWRDSDGVRLFEAPWPFTAMGHTLYPDEGAWVPSVSFKEILADAGPKIRLLKLDCEGAERPLLDSVDRLDQVQEIAGEIHYSMFDCTAPFQVAPTDAWLQDKLTALGFTELELVRSETHPHLISTFFARRTP